MASDDAHLGSTHPDPHLVDRPTPEALVDRFRRKGLFDTLRRDLMKEFQISDLKSRFETKLEEIVLDKLAYDQRRRTNDRPARLVVAPRVPLGDRTSGLSPTKERHEDVLDEVERHNLYQRTMREVEARFVNHANIKSMLYDLLEESRPPSKRRRTSECGHQPAQLEHPPPADKKASDSDSVRLVHLNPCGTSKGIIPAPSRLNNLDETPVVNSSFSRADSDRLDCSIDGRTDPEAHWPPPEDSLKVKIDLVHRKDTSDHLFLTASSDPYTLPSAATSSDIDGVPISRTSVANSFSESALMVKSSSSRRPSVENPSPSTGCDGEPLPSSNMTEQSFDFSDTAGRTVHKPQTSSSSTSKKFPSPTAVPLPVSSVSTPKSIQSTQALPFTRRFSLSTDHSSNKILSGGGTPLFSADSTTQPPGFASVVDSFSRSALIVKTLSSRRPSVENPSASTGFDGEPLASSNMTEQSLDLSDAAGVQKTPSSSSSTSKKFPSSLVVPLPTTSVSTPKSVQSAQTLPSTRQLSLSTDHSSKQIQSGGGTLLYSAESMMQSPGFGSSAIRPMSSHVSDEDAIDSAVDEFIRSLDDPPNKSEDGERDLHLSTSSSRFDGDPLPNSSESDSAGFSGSARSNWAGH